MKKLLLFPLVLVLACSTAFSQGTIKNNSYFNLIWSRPIMDNGVIYGSETPNNLREFYKAKYGTDLSHYSGAINDFTMTIKYDNTNSDFSNMAYGNRGIAKISLGQDGCLDLKKAIELGNKSVAKIYSEYCK